MRLFCLKKVIHLAIPLIILCGCSAAIDNLNQINDSELVKNGIIMGNLIFDNQSSVPFGDSIYYTGYLKKTGDVLGKPFHISQGDFFFVKSPGKYVSWLGSSIGDGTYSGSRLSPLIDIQCDVGAGEIVYIGHISVKILNSSNSQKLLMFVEDKGDVAEQLVAQRFHGQKYKFVKQILLHPPESGN